ncbi:ABC-three component system protein [Snodgrassella alvi]|uniref:ABC-three component system protein n=1 Tax=Snodgrassella alvi TaxID=1196083 RepID=UPI000C1E9B05|nr:ABC-three component system protein [Snodgrassella alvi]PIT45104.1 hypothetical protein BHC51_09050 [Snodgrassella alvi]
MNTSIHTENRNFEGQKLIGFDYQFYYFTLLALQLKKDESIGYEDKDDVQLDKGDGSTILFQLKHSSQRKKNGEIINLSSLDDDLWHTLYNWAKQVKSTKNFLDKHHFVLVSNKNHTDNQFISLYDDFNNDNDLDNVKNRLSLILSSTNSKTISKKIEEVISLNDDKLSLFLKNMKIFLNKDDIVTEIKRSLYDNFHIPEQFIDRFFNDLYAQLKIASYEAIKSEKKYILTKNEFAKIYNSCFNATVNKTRLPIRTFEEITPPANLEQLNFARQLIDIRAVMSDSQRKDKRLIRYCIEMLKADKYIKYWLKETAITSVDLKSYEKDCYDRWNNIFDSVYRKIENKLYSGVKIDELEEEIIENSIQVVDKVREINSSMPDYGSQLGIEFNNGFFWLLSNELKIGWHYDWERMYKKQ